MQCNRISSLTVLVAMSSSALAQSTAYVLTHGTNSNFDFGSSVAGAGDVDADGVPDIIVGNPKDNTNGTSAGAAFVYSGRTGALLRSWFGQHPSDFFGSSVDGLGDIDGDGYSDVIIGAPLYDFGSLSNSGRAYLFSGQSGANLSAYTDFQTGALTGSVVVGLGDIDGDGVGDFAFSSPKWDSGSTTDAGRVQICSGATGYSLGSESGASAGQQLGTSLALFYRFSSFPSPGWTFLVVGAPVNVLGTTDEVVLIDGQGSVLGTMYNAANPGSFGSAVAGIGDVDGDGIGDFAVGDPYYEAVGAPQDSGRVWVYSGLSYGFLRAIDGTSAGERFGSSLSELGDYDGDGVPDFLVGVPYADPAGLSDAGQAVVVSGADGSRIATWSATSSADHFGAAVGSAGDLNLDGTPDILIGAPDAPFGWGEVYVRLSHAPVPTTYCTAKTNSQACVPSVSSTGIASLSIADGLHALAEDVLNQKAGLCFWGTTPGAFPFYGATMCVQVPRFRTPVQSSGGSAAGNDCTGSYDFHFSQAYFQAHAIGAGSVLHAQYWSRDPGFAPPQNFGLTDALEFTVVP